MDINETVSNILVMFETVFYLYPSQTQIALLIRAGSV